MEQYIKKSALLAEIDRQKIGYNVDGKHSIEYDITRKILNIINTLEVKGVDLEEEITSMEDKYRGFESLSRADIIDVARHFFELGIQISNKTQKGE